MSAKAAGPVFWAYDDLEPATCPGDCSPPGGECAGCSDANRAERDASALASWDLVPLGLARAAPIVQGHVDDPIDWPLPVRRGGRGETRGGRGGGGLGPGSIGPPIFDRLEPDEITPFEKPEWQLLEELLPRCERHPRGWPHWDLPPWANFCFDVPDEPKGPDVPPMAPPADGLVVADCVPPTDRESARSTWEEKDHDRIADHVVLRPLNHDRGKLIVLLHGAFADARSVALIQEGLVASGFPVIALGWYANDGNEPRATCIFEPTDGAFNDCLERERSERFEVIAEELRAVLDDLQYRYPDEGWGTYLDPVYGQPSWPGIVFAGYSDGAGQTGFDLRIEGIVPQGAIFVSGGGDCGTLAPCDADNQTAADWADWPVVGSNPLNFVGLKHAGEPSTDLFTLGWDAIGMASTTADALAVSVEDVAFTDFHAAHRLEYDNGLTGKDAHTDPLDNESLFPAYMYLACVAGS